MTIKKHWTSRVPVLGVEIPRTKTLKPGYRERVVIAGNDMDSGIPTTREYVMLIVNDDVALFEEAWKLNNKVVDIGSFKQYFEGKIQRNQVESASRIHKLEMDEINDFLNPSYAETLHEYKKTENSIAGKEIDIKWEPTLPSQSRR